jgi:hypothetical protein
MSHPEEIEFVVRDSEKDGIADRAIIELDVDIKHHSAPGHFRMYSQFDLYSGNFEYEYKIEGTSVSIRLLQIRVCAKRPNRKSGFSCPHRGLLAAIRRAAAGRHRDVRERR